MFRLFLYSILISIILLFAFIQIAVPIVHSSHQDHILPVHKTLYLDRSMPYSEIFHIQEAAMEWNKDTNGQVIFDLKMLPAQINPSDAIIIFDASPDYPGVILIDNFDHQTTLGYFDDTTGINYIALIDSRIDDDFMAPVVMHELGHALGLQHNEGVKGMGSLMYPSIDLGSYHITRLDLERFCRLYSCDAGKFTVVEETYL